METEILNRIEKLKKDSIHVSTIAGILYSGRVGFRTQKLTSKLKNIGKARLLDDERNRLMYILNILENLTDN